VRRYVVLVAYVPGDWEAASDAVRQEYFAAHHAFEEYVDGHGRRIGSAPLAGADTATTIRHVDGKATVTDGPFVESAEQVGGYYDVELPDLDSAIAAGSLLPSSYAVEIRPVVTVEGYEPA
jgi:hypothetical protein